MKRPSKPSSAKAISENGTSLHGTAAQLRLISLAGGWDKHQKDLTSSAANEAVSQFRLKVATNYPITPYRETPPQSPRTQTGVAKSEASEIPGSANITSSSFPHDRH